VNNCWINQVSAHVDCLPVYLVTLQ